MDNRYHNFTCPHCKRLVNITVHDYVMDFIQQSGEVQYYHRACGLGRRGKHDDATGKATLQFFRNIRR